MTILTFNEDKIHSGKTYLLSSKPTVVFETNLRASSLERQFRFGHRDAPAPKNGSNKMKNVSHFSHSQLGRWHQSHVKINNDERYISILHPSALGDSNSLVELEELCRYGSVLTQILFGGIADPREGVWFLSRRFGA